MIGLLKLALGLALALFPALGLMQALDVRGRVNRFIAVLVLAASEIVLISIVLSLFKELTGGGLLLGELVFTAIVVLAGVRVRMPRLPRVAREEVVATVRANPLLSLLVLIAAGVMAADLGLALGVAPREWDSLSYHLSRSAYWLQYHTALPFAGASPTQLGQPPNAELLTAWTMALSGGDHFVQAVQWVAVLGIVACIYSGSRFVGISRRGAVFAAALFPCLPLPILESSSPQNDLVASFFIAAAVLFGVRAIRWRLRSDLVLWGLSVGIAVGTKGSALIAGPAILLVLIAAAWRWRPPRELLARGAAFAAAGVVLLGAFGYIANLAHTGSVFGGVTGQIHGDSTYAFLPVDVARDAWTFADIPGAGKLGSVHNGLEDVFRPPAKAIFASLPHRVDYGPRPPLVVSENPAVTTYGVIGIVLLFALVVTMFRRRAPSGVRVLALAALVYLVTTAAATGYNPWVGRILMPMVVLGLPVLAFAANRRWTAALAVLIAGGTVAQMLHQQVFEVKGLDRVSQETVQRPELRPALRKLDALIPANAPIAYMGDEESFDYPLFGPGRQRYVVRLDPRKPLSQIDQRKHPVAGVFYAQSTPQNGPMVEPVKIPNLPGMIHLSRLYAFLPNPALQRAIRASQTASAGAKR